MEDQEIEVKFFVLNLAAVGRRLKEMEAQQVQARTHELNLRFDTPDSQLARQFRVLRLRQDTAARLTFKGPAMGKDGVRIRQEIEFVVGDFRAARAFLEALGYQVSMIYEKFRAVYKYEGMLVALDELPYGSFVEIEGEDPAAIRAASQRLGLNWEASVQESYTMLFDRLRKALGFPFSDLVFENFRGLEIPAAAMNVRAADRAG